MLCCAPMVGQQGATAPVTVSVTDQTGAGIPHLQIRIVPAPDPTPKMETDEKGKLSLDLKPGGYALFARFSGFKPLATHFDVRAAKDLQTIPFVLQIATYSGPVVVVDAASKADLTLLAYPYHDPSGLSLAQLKALPHTMVTVHNPHTKADETYSGVRVADVLTPLGAPLGKELHGIALTNYLVATGSDGYQVVLALAEVDPTFHPGEVLVADTMNGKPLDAHSGPLKLVVTEDKRPARSVRNLTTIELRLLQ
ncbi:MAG: carboxypeptidase regulatory-like domain-containing protein [Candidatus Sulfotelmatobacter sp.]